MNDDDLRLLESARAGDHTAFARIYDRHAAVVLSLCRRGGGSLADAEDATQETFIRAYRRLDSLEDPTRFRPWLYRIAHHVCSERRRAAGRRLRHEGAAMIANVTANATRMSDADPAAQSSEDREALARLGEAIEQLDERERLAIHLHYLEADPIGSARSLGLSRSAYYKLLAKARARLATLMGEVPQS